MLLVLFLGAAGGWPATSAQLFWMPEAQCEATLDAIEPLQRALAVVCITAEGEVVGWK